jgi:hypothetical protein
MIRKAGNPSSDHAMELWPLLDRTAPLVSALETAQSPRRWPEGVRWYTFPDWDVRLSDRLKVGVAAVNSRAKPLIAELEGVDVSEKPEAEANLNTSRLIPRPTFDDHRTFELNKEHNT